MIENLSIETVIIVACVCGSVVLILSLILIVLCCQRHRTKDFYQKTETKILDPSEGASNHVTEAGLRPSSASVSGGRVTEQRPASPPTPRPQGDGSTPSLSAKECNPTPSSNPDLTTTYASLDRGRGINPSTQALATVPSAAAAAADDKRPRKVIYEVIV